MRMRVADDPKLTGKDVTLLDPHLTSIHPLTSSPWVLEGAG
ncbi:MAG: hypothetical protein ACRDN9_04050 [Streptosporangiaceae bacterium]